MPTVTKKLDIKFNNFRSLASRAEAGARRLIRDRINRIENDITTATASMLAFSIHNSPIIQALLGANAGDSSGKDLQAEFGLTDTMANTFARQLMNFLGNPRNMSLDLQTDKNKISTFKFTYLPANYRERILGWSVGSYPSTNVKGVQTEIPWLLWLMNNGIDAKANNYAIVFDDKVLDGLDSDRSRSGRAIMMQDPKTKLDYNMVNLHFIIPEMRRFGKIADKRYPWLYPSFAISRRGDFVQDLFDSRTFKDEIKLRITQSIQETISRFKK
jgi:hypothetical protein